MSNYTNENFGTAQLDQAELVIKLELEVVNLLVIPKQIIFSILFTK